MNKSELVASVSQKTQLTKQQIEAALDATFDIIQDCVCAGDEVKIVGFGVFTQINKRSRRGRNPKTGDEVTIPASSVPRFRPGKDFKNRIVKRQS